MRHAARIALLLAGVLGGGAGQGIGNNVTPLLLLPAAAQASEARDPGCGVTRIVAVSGAVTYRLPHGFVRAGSDSLWTRARTWVRGKDYLLDALRGDVRVLASLTPGETLYVASCWLLRPPPLEYARAYYRPLRMDEPAAAAPDSANVQAAPRPSTGRELANAPGGAQLSVTGNKTIAVEFGSSQDAALRQSLDLAVIGQLAPGVELTGVLSDRNTPLTAQGTTQDLQSLDRVLLELKAPRGSASFGDIPLVFDRGQFSRLERRVQGVRGEVHDHGFTASLAAASAQGEYNRMQFVGVDGLQGPYALTDRTGSTAITVVAGSEVVTVDGARMTRGESADYSIDYERARITFSNRRPVSSASRITVEYQYAVTRYRRNLAAFTGGWGTGAYRLFVNAIRESDDKGRPLDLTFSAQDLLTLAAAGDSAARAVGNGVTAGTGDYDSLRVALDTLIYVFVGSNAGHFDVRFARIGPGQGDYADSAVVAGRTSYRYVGPGGGAFVIGRALPLPESHDLLALGGSAAFGALTLEAEGATSKRDRNLYSALDDQNDGGAAGRLSAQLEGRLGPLPGRAGAQVGARTVARRFESFSRLERPFAEEDWGLPVGADLEHQRRGDGALWWQPRVGSELRVDVSALSTPDGYRGTRRHGEWTGAGRLSTHALWLESDGTLSGVRYGAAGRSRWLAEARFTGGVLVPAVHAEHDRRRTAADSAASVNRVDEVTGELASGAQVPWKLLAGLGERRETQEASAASSARARRATTYRLQAESPPTAPVGVGLSGLRRVAHDALAARTSSDLASVRLRGERKRWGLSGTMNVEVTSEAENQRVRTLQFVGAGRGAYDAFGNFVGTGDYDLVLTVSTLLDRYARVATSAHAAWVFGKSEMWRGSRMEFTLEDEARRRGELRLADAILSTGIALEDGALSRGAVLQRLEGELAPGSRIAALRMRAERRVAADRSFSDFAQTTDQRQGSLRWRARPGKETTVETEARVNWQRATQELAARGRYDRTIVEEGAQTQWVWQPGPALRLAGAADLGFSRPQGQLDATRTIKIGPDVSMAVGARGRAELVLRRAFVSGPPASALIPSVDPAGAARWDAHARFDLRLHETTTFGLSGDLRERPDRPTVVSGRAEVRAFF